MSVDVTRVAALAEVPHGFLGRTGGVSTGLYASLNCRLGSDDQRDLAIENRRRAVEAVQPGAMLQSLYQVHSATAVIVANPWGDDDRPQADALVSDRKGVVLGILTADCAPVLFADVEAGVVGAAHAGWKGAIGGVTDATICAMEGIGADRSRIVAAVGPCIAQASYEVDDAFRERFADHDPANDRFFRDGRADHAQFDLEGYVASRLAAAGIARVELTGLDTYANEARYFSYRRTTHRGEPHFGTQISLIGLDA